MSTIKTTTLSTLDGTATVPVNTVVNGSAKAWVNFNGTGTVAIRASFNVTSITDNGTGDYTVNFTTALADANYSVVGVTGGWGSAYNYATVNVGAGATPTTSAVRIATRTAGTFNDEAAVCISVFR
jgi:hypothetical protein